MVYADPATACLRCSLAKFSNPPGSLQCCNAMLHRCARPTTQPCDGCHKPLRVGVNALIALGMSLHVGFAVPPSCLARLASVQPRGGAVRKRGLMARPHVSAPAVPGVQSTRSQLPCTPVHTQVATQF